MQLIRLAQRLKSSPVIPNSDLESAILLVLRQSDPKKSTHLFSPVRGGNDGMVMLLPLPAQTPPVPRFPEDTGHVRSTQTTYIV